VIVRRETAGGQSDDVELLIRADDFAAKALALNLQYRFVITGDGYRSKTKRQSGISKSDRVANAARMTMVLYKPGDTRMLTIFRMLQRVLFLIGPLTATFSDASYDAIAQKCIRNSNSQCKDPAKKITEKARNGKLVDVAKQHFGAEDSPIYDEIEQWLQVPPLNVPPP